MDQEDWMDRVELSQKSISITSSSQTQTPSWASSQFPKDWKESLELALRRHSGSILGEIGLDRVARIPTTIHWKPKLAHQVALFQFQIDLASRLSRPVSIHLVQSFGLALSLFAALKPSSCPPSLCLHSCTASPEWIASILSLPNGLGSRFYFSFSSVINSRTKNWSRQVSQVPENRLLLESDLKQPMEINESLDKVSSLLAKLKGWSREKLISRTTQNYWNFVRGSSSLDQSSTTFKYISQKAQKSNLSIVPDLETLSLSNSDSDLDLTVFPFSGESLPCQDLEESLKSPILETLGRL